MYSDLLSALPEVFGLANFAAVVIGVIAGIVVGAMPGLSATMAISVLVPFTFGLEPLVALGLMAGIYNGAMYGGAIPAVLLRIPGTPQPLRQRSTVIRWRKRARADLRCKWPSSHLRSAASQAPLP